MPRRVYIETPANCYANHQSNVRFWAKMRLIVGLASRVCQANGVDGIPAVRETLGRLAVVGSEFAGRHMLYEKFYAGNSIVVRNQSDREAPWERFHGIVDRLLGGIAVPDFTPETVGSQADKGAL